jgi:hypothetical protein
VSIVNMGTTVDSASCIFPLAINALKAMPPIRRHRHIGGIAKWQTEAAEE